MATFTTTHHTNPQGQGQPEPLSTRLCTASRFLDATAAREHPNTAVMQVPHDCRVLAAHASRSHTHAKQQHAHSTAASLSHTGNCPPLLQSFCPGRPPRDLPIPMLPGNDCSNQVPRLCISTSMIPAPWYWNWCQYAACGLWYAGRAPAAGWQLSNATSRSH
jgi:hypothetical protein